MSHTFKPGDRVQIVDKEDSETGTIVSVEVTYRVRWDDCSIPIEHTADDLRPAPNDGEPSERDLERHNDPERIADLRYHHFGEGR